MMTPEPTPAMQSADGMQTAFQAAPISREEVQAGAIDRNLNSDKLADILKYFTSTFEAYKNARTAEEDGWTLSSDLYDGDYTEADWPYSSRYEIREVFRQVEALDALTQQMLFGNRQYFKYQPRFEDFADDANAATHIVHWQLRQFRLKEQLRRWTKATIKFGTSYIFYGWSKYKSQKILGPNFQDIETDSEKRNTPLTWQGGPCLEWMNHNSIYFWPEIMDDGQQPYAFIYERVTSQYLMSLVREGKLDESAVKQALNKNRGSGIAELNWAGGGRGPFEERADEFDLVWCYTASGWLYARVGADTIAAARMHPYEAIPIFALKNYPQEGRHYGISEPMILAASQALLRDLASMWVDSNHYNNQPMWLIKDYLKKQFENLPFQPGQTIPVQQMEDVMPLRSNNAAFNLQQGIEFVRRFMTMETGVTDEVTGQGSRHRTATGLLNLQRAASARIELKVLDWVDTFEAVYAKLYNLNGRYLDSSIAMQIQGLDGREVFGRYDNTVFDPDVDVEIVLPQHWEDPGVKQQRFMLLYNLARQDPMINKAYVLEELGRAFELPNPKKLLVMPARSEQDALEEIADITLHGMIADPYPTDDHQIHANIHQMFETSPAAAALPEMSLRNHQRHLRIHMRYLQQIQALPQYAGGGGGPQEGGENFPAEEGANIRAEGQFDNAGRGAAQQASVGMAAQ
jgi:hypothetical protein